MIRITLRVMTEEDIPWVAEYTGLGIQHITDWFHKLEQLYFIVEPFYGYVRIGVCDRSEVNIGIVIRPERQGIGTAVLEILTDICRRLGFIQMNWTTRPDNLKSIAFARKHGFELQLENQEKVRLIKQIL